MAITNEDMQVMSIFSQEIDNWVNGIYLNEKNANKFLAAFQKVKHLLPKYVDGTLYRACWISKSEFKIASGAKKLELKTSKKSVQSWTDRFDTATNIYGVVMNKTRSKNFINCIVEAKIPGKLILVSLRDLEMILQKYSKFYDKNHGEDEDYRNVFEDTLIYMSEFYDEREWIINVDGPVRVSSIKTAVTDEDGWDDVIDWKELKTGAAPESMTLILDPNSGLLTLESEAEQLPLAASLKFQSRLLN